MRKIEVKKCKKCGKAYVWESGGIVSTPADYMDLGMCSSCRVKTSYGTLKKVLDKLKKRDKYG